MLSRQVDSTLLQTAALHLNYLSLANSTLLSEQVADLMQVGDEEPSVF